MGEVSTCFAPLAENEVIESVAVSDLDMGSGCATLSLSLKPSLYFDVLSELAGEEIRDEAALFALVKELAVTRDKYERVREALESVEQTGYGIVMPRVEDLTLEKPTIIKQSGGFGVRMCASAQSMHMIRAEIRTELNPIVGTEQQSEEFVKNILADFESDPKKLWESNMFGKTLYELVNDGLHEKLTHIPQDARKKLSETLERIVNDGANGLICVLL
jgi:stage IV sporulation protein A